MIRSRWILPAALLVFSATTQPRAQSVRELRPPGEHVSAPLRYDVTLRVHRAAARGALWLWADELSADNRAPCEIELRTTGRDAVVYELSCSALFAGVVKGEDVVVLDVPFVGRTVTLLLHRASGAARFVASDIDIGNVTLLHRGRDPRRGLTDREGLREGVP